MQPSLSLENIEEEKTKKEIAKKLPAPRSKKEAYCGPMLLAGCEADGGRERQKKPGPGGEPRPGCGAALKRRRVRCFGRSLRGIGGGSDPLRFGHATVELTGYLGANRPGRDLCGCGLLALAVRALVDRADETALDEHVRALLDRGRDVLRESRAKDRDAMPLGLRDPLVFGVLPGPLCGHGEDGEFRTVVPRLALLGIGTNKPD